MKTTSIAVLLTCFNRKDKTLACLERLYKAHVPLQEHIRLDIYLTDDGSTDGTGDAVRDQYPKVHVLKGTGDLYWAGGMRHSWKEALQGDYDAYLLLNDDTDVHPNFLTTLLSTGEFCLQNYGQEGVYIGSTKDKKSNSLSYGGAKLTNTFWFKYQFIQPTDTPQECDLGNANIMWVPRTVVKKIGILSEGYIHGVADYDYTLKARKKNVPVLITPGFLGHCTDDHENAYSNFHKLSIRQRIKKLWNPIGLDLRSNLLLQRKFFPVRVPFVLFSAFLKVVFPKMYIKRFDFN